MEFDIEFFRHILLKLAEGVPFTLALTFLSLAIAFVPALITARYKTTHKTGMLVYGINGVITFIRGTPLILQLLLIYSFVPSLLNYLVHKLGLKLDVFALVPPFYYALMVFVFQAYALLTEILRSSLNAVDKGQYEASLLFFNSQFKAFYHVILPQVLVSALPNITNLTINLIKGSALAFVIGVTDILAVAKIEAAFSYTYLEAYLAAFVYYVVICSGIDYLSARSEAKISTYKLQAH